MAPVYALLLHQWVLNSVTTISGQGPKLLNVLVTGVRQLFGLDVSKGTVRAPCSLPLARQTPAALIAVEKGRPQEQR